VRGHRLSLHLEPDVGELTALHHALEVARERLRRRASVRLEGPLEAVAKVVPPVVPPKDEERTVVHHADVRAARRGRGRACPHRLPHTRGEVEAAEVVEGRAARLASEGVDAVAVHDGGVASPRRRGHAARADGGPLAGPQVHPKEVVERAGAIIPAKDIQRVGRLVHGGRRGRARAWRRPRDPHRRPLGGVHVEGERVVEVVPPVAAAKHNQPAAMHHCGVAAPWGGGGAGGGLDAPLAAVEAVRVEVREVPLRVVASEHVQPAAEQDGCMRVSRRGAAVAIDFRVDGPRARLEGQNEQVVAVCRSVVAAKDVHARA